MTFLQKIIKGSKTDFGKSITTGYVVFFLNNVVALFLTPYILKYISKEEYGFYILCLDFLSWMMFLEFGSSKVIESKTGHLLANGDENGILRSFNSALFFQVFVAILIVPVFYVLVVTGLKTDKIPGLSIIIILFSLSAGLSIVRNIFASMIIASRKIHLDNKIQVAINILNYAFILMLVPFFGIWGLAFISLSMAILMLFRSYRRVFKLFPYLSISTSHFNKVELKALLSSGIYFSIGSIATLLIAKFDSFFLGRSFGLEEVTKFYISIKLIAIAEKLITTVINNVRPYISKFYGQKKIYKIHFFYNLAVPVLLIVCFISIAVLMLINKFFITIWVGKEFLIGQSFIIIFGLYTILHIITLPARIILTSTLYNLRMQSVLRICEGILRVSIILVFIKIVQINILPLSNLISSMVFGFIGLHFLLKTLFKDYNINIGYTYCYFLIISILLVLLLNYSGWFMFTPYLLIGLALLLSFYIFVYDRKTTISNFNLLKQDEE